MSSRCSAFEEHSIQKLTELGPHETIIQMNDHLNTLPRKNKYDYAKSVKGMVAALLMFSGRNRYRSVPMVIPINIEDMLLEDMLNMLKG